jgi:phage/plasmid-like protein (TIGR03299 family)
MVMASNRRPAFELLGGKYVQAASAASAASQAGLDWTVSLQPISANYVVPTEDGGQIVNNLPISDKFATVKTTPLGEASVLGVVGSRYGIVQNSEMFSALDSIVDSGDAKFTAAGQLDGGKQVYMVMELPEGVSIRGDEHASYLLARTSHDGSTALQITSVINRLSCTNQINTSFLRNKKNGIGVYSLRHTSNAKVEAQKVRDILRVVYADIDWYSNVSANLYDKKMEDNEVKNFLESVWTLDPKIEYAPYDMLSQGEKRARSIAINARQQSFDIYKGATGTQENLYGSALGAWQAVVEWADWFSSKDDEIRAERTMLGSSDEVKHRSLQLLGA